MFKEKLQQKAKVRISVNEPKEESGERVFNAPTMKIQPLSDVAKQYLNDVRKLSDTTLAAFGVGVSKKGGAIAIPFFNEKQERVLIKLRSTSGEQLEWVDRDGKQRKSKTYCVPNGKPVLLGSHLAKPENGNLVIAFGDYDALSLHEAGIPNATSVPYGDQGDGFIKEQREFLKSFEFIVLFPDLDKFDDWEARERAKQKINDLARKLGTEKCVIVNEFDYNDCKDPNELLVKFGKDALIKAVNDAMPMHGDKITDLASVSPKVNRTGVLTGVPDIDKRTNGFQGGELVILSGDNEAGKTTTVLTLAAQVRAQELRSFIWSGEIPEDALMQGYERLFVSPEQLIHYENKYTEADWYELKPELAESVRKQYAGYVQISTHRCEDERDLFELMEQAARWWGVKIFFIDNMMAWTSGIDGDYFESQANFTKNMKYFAIKWDVVVVIVTHNRKRQNEYIEPPDKNDVEGTKKITNWADIVLQLWRVPTLENADKNQEMRERFKYCQSVWHLCKNRRSGQGVRALMKFNRGTGRTASLTDYEEARERLRMVNSDTFERVFWEQFDFFGRARKVGEARANGTLHEDEVREIL